MTKPTRLTAADTTTAVDQYMASLDHPHKALIQALRELVLATDPAIAEGIKWKRPSYRTGEYFATTNLRLPKGVGMILHLGAKVRDGAVTIEDPAHLLTWHGENRASFVVADMAALHEHAPALKAILVQWLRHV